MIIETFVKSFLYTEIIIVIVTYIVTSDKILKLIPKENYKFKYFFHIFHSFVVYSLLLGWMLPKKYLNYYFMSFFVLFFHWKINNQKCIITQIQQKLDNKMDDKNYSFTGNMFNNFGIKLNRNQAYLMSYWMFIFVFFIGLYRVCV